MTLPRHFPVPLILAAFAALGACQNQGPAAPATTRAALPQIERPVLDPNVAIGPTDCAQQVKTITAALRAGPDGRPEQVREVLRLAAMYDRVKAAKADQAVLDQACGRPLRELTNELVLLLHKRAQKDKDDESRVLAAELYRLYLDRFSEDPSAYTLGFYQAELSWTMEQWRAAAERYDWVAERDPRGKHALEAAYAALLAWKNLVEGGKPAGESAAGDSGLAARPLGADERKLVGAMDRYLALAPDGAERVKIEYRRARLHYEHNLFEEAIPLFQGLVERHPEHELAVYSANLLLDSLNALGRGADVLRWVDRFLAMPALMKDEELARQMRTIKSDGLDAAGRQAQKAGDFTTCGRKLLAAAELAPQENQPERLFNAVRCFRSAGRPGEAARARELLLRRHPTDPLARRLATGEGPSGPR